MEYKTETVTPRPTIEDLVSEDHIAEVFRVSKQTVAKWRLEKGLPYVKLGNHAFFLEKDFMDWIEKTKIRLIEK